MTARRERRKKVEAKVRALQGIYAFARAYGSGLRSQLDRVAEAIQGATQRDLDAMEADILKLLDKAAQDLRPTQPTDFYGSLFTRARRNPSDYLFFAKWWLGGLFADPGHVYPDLQLLPAHTKVSVDIHGRDPDGARGEWRLIEAALFEDMCAHFNAAWSMREALPAAESSRVLHKQSAASRRGAVASAFYFVEAYLNSIAFDHIIAQPELSAADRGRLTEWDDNAKKQRLETFRDKLLHYPRIILGEKHPPLQENNSPSHAYLLREAKEFRDAVVHASPIPRTSDYALEKEARFWRIGVWKGDVIADAKGNARSLPEDSWVTVVDAAIDVVMAIEQRLRGNTERLFWLHRRLADGAFPDSVFL